MPTGPKAVVSTSGSPFGAGSNQTLTGYALTLDASQSIAGINMVPPYQNSPITTYGWSITLVNGTTLTSSTLTVILSSDEIGSLPGNIVATLIVTAPSPTNTPAPNYAPTGITSYIIQVFLTTGGNNQTNGQLDIWTQNGGQGIDANATAFGPNN